MLSRKTGTHHCSWPGGRNLFAGFIITQPYMVPWWRWYSYVNPVAWTLYGIIVTQLGQNTTVVRSTVLAERACVTCGTAAYHVAFQIHCPQASL